MNSPDPARLARLERQVNYLLQHLGIDPGQAAGEPASASTFSSPGDIFGSAAAEPGTMSYPPELVTALQQNKLIEAIKIYREQTGVGLKDAKKAVEAIDRELRLR